MNLLQFLYCILAFLWFVQPRIIQISFPLTQFYEKQAWLYLDKMTFERGIATIKVQIEVTSKSMKRAPRMSNLVFSAIPQENWAQEIQSKCIKDATPGDIRSIVNLEIQSQEGRQSSMEGTSFVIDVERDIMYYFVLKDCLRILGEEQINPDLMMLVRLTLTNNGKQIGAQEDHWLIVPLVMVVGIWLSFYNKEGMMIGNDNNWAKRLLIMGIFTNISSLTWRTFGFIIYLLTGWDYMLFHIIYLLMHSISESLVIGLIILIAYGWSINFTKGNKLHFYLPIMSTIAGFNVVTTLLTKVNNRQHDRHHIFDSLPGMMLVLFRTLLLLPFTIGIVMTYRSSRHTVKQFIAKFAVFGFLYLSALPIIWLWAHISVAQKNQNQFVFVAVECIKTLCNILLTYHISHKNSKYQQVCYQRNNFIPLSFQGL